MEIWLTALLLSILACSDDAGDSVNHQDDSNINNESINKESVQNIRDLGTCSNDNEGSQVYVKNADANYTCSDKVWKLVDENDSSETSSSSAEPKSSSSQASSSSSEKTVENPDSDEPSSSSAEPKSSSSQVSSSSSEKTVESSDSKETSSSSAEKKSSSSTIDDRPITEIGATLENLSVCDDQKEGMLVYIQLDDAVYECHAGEYRDVEYNLDIPSSSSAASSEENTEEPSEEDPNDEPETPSTDKSQSILSVGKYDSTFVDKRDNKTYGLIKVGPYLWMGENLNYVSEGGNADDGITSWCYNNDPAYCERGGRLYLWTAAMNLPAGTSLDDLVLEDIQGICPEGLRMPTTDEIAEVKEFLASIEDMRLHGFSMDFYGFHGNNFGKTSQSGYPDLITDPYTQKEATFVSGESAFWTASHNGHDFAEEWFLWFTMEKISGEWSITEFRNESSKQPPRFAFSVRCMTRTEPMCTEDNDGEYKETDKELMICDNNRWRPPSATELTYFALGDSLCAEQGEVVFTHQHYEICDDGKWRFATKTEYNMGLTPCENWDVGLGKIDKNEYFICKNKVWSTTNHTELAVKDKECSWSNRWETIRSSLFPDEFYACSTTSTGLSGWIPANDMQKDTYSYSCEDWVVVNGIFNKENKYICRNGAWDNASEIDLETDGIPCYQSENNQLIWGKVTPDRILACLPSENNEYRWQDLTSNLLSQYPWVNKCTKNDRDSVIASWTEKGTYYACTSPTFTWTIASQAQLAMRGYKCSDETSGLVQQGPDEKYYTCHWSGWSEATTTEYDTYGKECNVSAIVPGNINKDIMYSCNKYWHEATEDDYDVEGIKCEPGIIVTGKINTEKNYACYATGIWREATDMDYDVEGYECSELGDIKSGKVDSNNQYECTENGWAKIDE